MNEVYNDRSFYKYWFINDRLYEFISDRSLPTIILLYLQFFYSLIIISKMAILHISCFKSLENQNRNKIGRNAR